MNKKLIFLLLLTCGVLHAQDDNNLTASPYSIFGLGVGSNAGIGKNSALGRGGYALNGPHFINNNNPAAFGVKSSNSFIYDFGFLTEITNAENSNSSDKRAAGNFSSLALAANIDSKSSFGLSITPYTNVGYNLIGVTSNIEGSVEDYQSNLNGSGSINEIRASYGRTFLENLRLGASFSYLFGTIEQREEVFAGLSTLNISDINKYEGFRVGIGLQYDYEDFVKFGFTINAPTFLNANRDRTIERTLDFTVSEEETIEDEAINDFDLPLEIGYGFLAKPWKNQNLWINFDQNTRLWGATDQSDNIATYVDQNIFSLGAEYFIDDNGLKYYEHIDFRAGVFYDTGYLSIRNEKIDTFGASAGIGLPLGLAAASKLNITYTYSNRGSSNSILVKENIHSININLTLKDFWFRKRQIN